MAAALRCGFDRSGCSQIVALAHGGPRGLTAAAAVPFLVRVARRQDRAVDGPTAQGLYTVQLPLRPEQTLEIEQALRTLQQNRGVVRWALEKK